MSKERLSYVILSYVILSYVMLSYLISHNWNWHLVKICNKNLRTRVTSIKENEDKFQAAPKSFLADYFGRILTDTLSHCRETAWHKLQSKVLHHDPRMCEIWIHSIEIQMHAPSCIITSFCRVLGFLRLSTCFIVEAKVWMQKKQERLQPAVRTKTLDGPGFRKCCFNR